MPKIKIDSFKGMYSNTDISELSLDYNPNIDSIQCFNGYCKSVGIESLSSYESSNYLIYKDFDLPAEPYSQPTRIKFTLKAKRTNETPFGISFSVIINDIETHILTDTLVNLNEDRPIETIYDSGIIYLFMRNTSHSWVLFYTKRKYYQPKLDLTFNLYKSDIINNNNIAIQRNFSINSVLTDSIIHNTDIVRKKLSTLSYYKDKIDINDTFIKSAVGSTITKEDINCFVFTFIINGKDEFYIGNKLPDTSLNSDSWVYHIQMKSLDIKNILGLTAINVYAEYFTFIRTDNNTLTSKNRILEQVAHIDMVNIINTNTNNNNNFSNFDFIITPSSYTGIMYYQNTGIDYYKIDKDIAYDKITKINDIVDIEGIRYIFDGDAVYKCIIAGSMIQKRRFIRANKVPLFSDNEINSIFIMGNKLGISTKTKIHIIKIDKLESDIIYSNAGILPYSIIKKLVIGSELFFVSDEGVYYSSGETPKLLSEGINDQIKDFNKTNIAYSYKYLELYLIYENTLFIFNFKYQYWTKMIFDDKIHNIDEELGYCYLIFLINNKFAKKTIKYNNNGVGTITYNTNLNELDLLFKINYIDIDYSGTLNKLIFNRQIYEGSTIKKRFYTNLENQKFNEKINLLIRGNFNKLNKIEIDYDIMKKPN